MQLIITLTDIGDRPTIPRLHLVALISLLPTALLHPHVRVINKYNQTNHQTDDNAGV